MKIKNGFTKRNIAGSEIVVPVGKTAKEFNGMITLNETGAFLWDCYTEEETVDGAVRALLGEYDVDEATARRDVEGFVKMLKDNGLIEE
ncbi:MAG: PqqD family protein [Eubacterium sp.]|nr:PqqD family protein [Eubacterium sp.]